MIRMKLERRKMTSKSKKTNQRTIKRKNQKRLKTQMMAQMKVKSYQLIQLYAC